MPKMSAKQTDYKITVYSSTVLTLL